MPGGSETPTNAEAIYADWEQRLDSWEAFQEVVLELTHRHSSREMVWRGARRAEWGLMSSLYRVLFQLRGEPPTEDDLNAAEDRTLTLARKDWRFDDRPALELLAHLQHYGAPTRLLDVSLNPLIALWFAVEERPGDDEVDARIFAFVTNSRPVALNPRWGGRYLRWHRFEDDEARRAQNWGTGRRRRIWRPPAYFERISAQNAAFLLDGAPLDAPAPAESEPREYVSIEQLKRVSSINLRFSRVERDDLPPEAAPVFTLRIAAEAKPEIRDQLERRFGYRASSIYSDILGLAEHLREHPEVLG
jgi:FRG domain